MRKINKKLYVALITSFLTLESGSPRWGQFDGYDSFGYPIQEDQPNPGIQDEIPVRHPEEGSEHEVQSEGSGESGESEESENDSHIDRKDLDSQSEISEVLSNDFSDFSDHSDRSNQRSHENFLSIEKGMKKLAEQIARIESENHKLIQQIDGLTKSKNSDLEKKKISRLALFINLLTRSKKRWQLYPEDLSPKMH